MKKSEVKMAMRKVVLQHLLEEDLESLRKSNRRSAESFTFYLNYCITVWILLITCLFLFIQPFASYSMQCLPVPEENITADVLNAYCSLTSTYPVNASLLEQTGSNLLHPDVLKAAKFQYGNYFPKVPIVLLLQAISFYIPYAIWKKMEPSFLTEIPKKINRRVFETAKEIIESPHMPLDKPLFSNSPLDKALFHKLPLDDVVSLIVGNWDRHNSLVFKYFFCEALATINVFAETFMLDAIFHGKLLALWSGDHYSFEIVWRPISMFPPATVCFFPGIPGYADPINALCRLPMNPLNEKIFLGLWLWFTLLSTLSLLRLFYFVGCMFFPVLRISPLKIYPLFFKDFNAKDCYEKLAVLLDFGDWFVLSSLKRNIPRFYFKYITSYLLCEVIYTENRLVYTR